MSMFAATGRDADLALYSLRITADEAAGALSRLAQTKGDAEAARADAYHSVAGLAAANEAMGKIDAAAAKKKKVAKHGGGGGGTNIQKVEIVVTSNNEPGRVARLVVDEIAKLRRNPRSSPFRDDYGAIAGY